MSDVPRSLATPSPGRAAPDSRDEPLFIERARGGDRAAFSQLVRMHQAVVRAYLGAHVREAEAADDLAQEVFLRAFRRLDAFQLPDSGTMRPWLLGIAANLSECQTIVVDDSGPLLRELQIPTGVNCQLVSLPFDSGLSAKRNAGGSRLTEPTIVLQILAR